MADPWPRTTDRQSYMVRKKGRKQQGRERTNREDNGRQGSGPYLLFLTLGRADVISRIYLVVTSGEDKDITYCDYDSTWEHLQVIEKEITERSILL